MLRFQENSIHNEVLSRPGPVNSLEKSAHNIVPIITERAILTGLLIEHDITLRMTTDAHPASPQIRPQGSTSPPARCRSGWPSGQLLHKVLLPRSRQDAVAGTRAGYL